MDPIITIEANKDLTIKLERQEERDELAEILEIDGTDQALAYLLEDEAVNGGYTAFDAGNGTPSSDSLRHPALPSQWILMTMVK